MYILWNKLWAKAVNGLDIMKYLLTDNNKYIIHYKAYVMPQRWYLKINV